MLLVIIDFVADFINRKVLTFSFQCEGDIGKGLFELLLYKLFNISGFYSEIGSE